MISKEIFIEYLNKYQLFNNKIEKIEEIFGRYIFESDWVDAVGHMLDIFLDENFTEEGKDWIYYALFEEGIDSTVSIPQILSDKGIFEVSGRWWYYPSKDNVQSIAGVECKFGSKSELQNLLRTNEDFKNELVKLINVDEVSSEEKEKIDAEEEANNAFMMDVNASMQNENKDESDA
jgi:hypothetical protein